jgi:hypothetical protein
LKLGPASFTFATSQATEEAQGMTSQEDRYRRGPRYSVDEFVAKLKEFVAQKSSEGHERSDCALVVTDTGLDLCCVVDTENGKEVECTDVLDILKPE